MELRITRGITLPLQCIISPPQLENLNFEDLRGDKAPITPTLVTPLLRASTHGPTILNSSHWTWILASSRVYVLKEDRYHCFPLSRLIVLQLGLTPKILKVVSGLLQ
jgi:hypothetical protein